jgi:hypothetical protein
MSGIAPKQNVFKFKIAPHKQKSIVKNVFWQEDGSLANRALCLSTPNHNGKFGPGQRFFYPMQSFKSPFVCIVVVGSQSKKDRDDFKQYDGGFFH